MKTLVATEDGDFFHAREWLDTDEYECLLTNLMTGQRLGQAFMNSLNRKDFDTLANSPADPYGSNSASAVSDAIKYLLEN